MYWGKIRKRIFAGVLSAVLLISGVDISMFTLEAKTAESVYADNNSETGEEPELGEEPEPGEEQEPDEEPKEEPIHEHIRETIITKATTTKNGSIIVKCKECGEVISEDIIYAATSITLSKNSYEYNGHAKNPAVVMKDCNGNKIDSTNYIVSYIGECKNVGSYWVNISLKGNYLGKARLSFVINPAGVNFSRVSGGKRKISLQWKAAKNSQVTGYEIQYDVSSMFDNKCATIKIKSRKKCSYTISNLKKHANYYVRIRTYKVVKGIRYRSEWSKVKSIRTSK